MDMVVVWTWQLFSAAFERFLLNNSGSDFTRNTWLRQVQCVFFLLNLLLKDPDFCMNICIRPSFQSLSDFVKSQENKNILNRLD